jgi:hypothetical protein
MFSFITFILEDEHVLSLGMLMHVKCIHKLCSLLSYIATYLHAMRCYIHVLHSFRGIFIDLLYLVYSFAEQETPMLCIFKFQGPSGTQTELGFFNYFSLRMSKRSRST